MPEQPLDLGEYIKSLATLGGGYTRKLTPQELLRRATEKAAEEEKAKKEFINNITKTIAENPESQVETSNSYVENLRKSYLAQQQDTEKFRQRANMTPQELMNEYKNMFYDQKKGWGHSINRFLQGFAYGPEVDQNAAKTAYDQFPKNQQRVVDAGKAEDNSARVLEQASRLRQQAVDKFNSEKQKRILDAYGKALSSNNPAEIKLIEMAAKAENMDMSVLEKAKADALKGLQVAASNPMTASQVQSPDMLQKGIDLTGRLAMEKGIPGIIGKMLGEKSQQVVDLGKMVSRPDGSMIPVANPQMKSGPSLGAKMLQGGTSIPSMIDMLRNKAGENRQQFMPGSIPSQPQQGMPAAPQTLQPQSQGIQPGGQSFQPQAQVAQPMNANPLAYTKPNQGIPEKQAATFENKDLTIPRGPGDRYTIAKFIKPQVSANEKRYGMKAIEGDGTTDDKKLYNTNAEFVATASALNNSIAEGFNTRSKFPGQTAMDRIFGSPFNQPGIQGAWNKAMNGFSSSAPNREGAWGALKDKILSLKGSDKNYEQTKSIVQSQLDQLVGKFEDDPGTLKVYNDLNMNLSKILSNYTKAVTGSQVNEKELELFAQVVPDLFKTPETSTQMLLNFTTRAGLINSLRSAGYKEPVIQELMSNPMIVEEVKNYTRAYADDLVSQIPRNSNRPGVKVKGPVDKSRLNPANILGYLSEKFPDQLKGVVVRPVEKGRLAPSVQLPSTATPQKPGYQDALEQYKRWRPQ